jgi:cystathionine beta-lyase
MLAPPFEVLTPADLRGRSSLKWSHFGPDVLPLWVAEMDVLPAPEVVEVLVAAARAGDTGYPTSDRGFAESMAAFAAQRWGWRVDPAATATCADVMTGIQVLVEHLVPRGGSVVIPTPVYPPFADFTREVDRVVVPAALSAEGRLDPAAIEAAVAAAAGSAAEGPPAILLCSPHNPTGTVHTRAELEAVAGIADRLGSTVIVDEVHAPLVPAGAEFVPWLAVSELGFVVTSAAKAFNLAGLKAALIVAGPGSRAELRALPGSVRFGASHLGIVAQRAAYGADPAWLDAVNANIAANRALLGTVLAGRIPLIGYRQPEATYLAWLDCRDLGLGDDPARTFLKRGQVALGQGPTFGPGGEGFARLNLACSAAVLTEAVDRMASVVPAPSG